MLHTNVLLEPWSNDNHDIKVILVVLYDHQMVVEMKSIPGLEGHIYAAAMLYRGSVCSVGETGSPGRLQ